jgi:hypothetical protein
LLVIALAGASCDSISQTFPAKPIRIIVGAGSGGGVDTISRIVGQRLANGGISKSLWKTGRAPAAQSRANWSPNRRRWIHAADDEHLIRGDSGVA